MRWAYIFSMRMGKRQVARLADGRWPIGAAVGSLKAGAIDTLVKALRAGEPG